MGERVAFSKAGLSLKCVSYTTHEAGGTTRWLKLRSVAARHATLSRAREKH